ncbi:MAG: DUF4153 domain-containing protein [Allosphingosinicella sp.]
MDESDRLDHRPWPLRALLLLLVGALLGLAIHFLTRGPEIWKWTENPVRLGAAAALAAGGIVFAFSLERLRPFWSLAFAVAAGAVIGFVTYWNGQPDGWGAGEGWQLVSGLLAVAIAVPLFQAVRDAGERKLDYPAVYAHAWTNVVLWLAAWAFVLLSFLLLNLLAELFQLIGIDLLRKLIDKDWADWMFFGGALGGAVGLLRDRDRILGLLQKVATAVLAVLAPILAVGLILFVLALPFTGLEPLWEQTKATTPIILSCVIGALVLVNAAIGSGGEEEARSPIVRWAAMALAVIVLPLAIVAAVSTGKRIAQHGLTPDRLWAAVFVAITVAAAAAYLYAIIRGRAAWAPRLRSLNLRLAIGICLVALLLALPIVSFGAISTRSQLARLESGRIAPDKFDWAALRFDFGPSGRRAVERLARSSNPVIRDNAKAALAAESRWAARNEIEQYAEAPRGMRVFPAEVPVPAGLRDAVLGQPGRPGACTGKGDCFLFWKPGDTIAFAIMDPCPVEPKPEAAPPLGCGIRREVIELKDGRWPKPDEEVTATTADPDRAAAERRRQREGLRRGEIEVREITRHQLFIGGEPVGTEY